MPPMETFVFPGKGIDMDEDYDEWSLPELRDRVKLVQDLDALADRMVEQAIQMAKDYSVMEVQISVPQTVMVMRANY